MRGAENYLIFSWDTGYIPRLLPIIGGPDWCEKCIILYESKFMSHVISQFIFFKLFSLSLHLLTRKIKTIATHGW